MNIIKKFLLVVMTLACITLLAGTGCLRRQSLPVSPSPTPAYSPIVATMLASSQDAQLPVLTPTKVIGRGIPTSLAVSPDGQWLAVGTLFGVYLYDATQFGTPRWFVLLPEHAGAVVFGPQSDRLGVAIDSGVLILSVSNGDILARLEGAGRSIAWAPDGRRLATGSGCQQVVVWDVERGAALKELSGGKCSEGYSGVGVTWAADGRIYGVSMGTKIMAWDGETYAALEDFSARGAEGTWLSEILAAPAGSLLAQFSGMGGTTVAIIDGKQDQQLHLLDQQVNGEIVALAWMQDGVHLAVAYGSDNGLVLVWNALTGQVEQRIESFYFTIGLGWSADGSTLIGMNMRDGQIDAISLSSGKILRSIGGHARVGNFLTWTARDGLVSTNGAVITRWSASLDQPLSQESAYSPQGWVTSWPPSGPGTFLFDTSARLHQVGAFDSRKDLENEVDQYPVYYAWSMDGSLLANATDVWEVSTGRRLAQLKDPTQNHLPDRSAWSPDGKRLASADSLNMQAPVIWDAQTGQVITSLQSDTGDLKPIWLGLAWSPDGKKLAAVGALMHPDSGLDEGMILVWDVQTGRQESLLTDGMHGYRLWTVAWSPDGNFMACGSTSSELFVWDMAHRSPVAVLQGHRDMVDSLAWSPDPKQRVLVTASRDGTLMTWDLSTMISGSR